MLIAREAIRNVSFLENLVAYLIDNTGFSFFCPEYQQVFEVTAGKHTYANHLELSESIV